jgi:excisionase family DNA binding protein
VAVDELDVVSMQDAAKILHISRTTLWRYIRDGKIPALKYSTKKVLIKREELERFVLESQKRST